MSDPIYNQIPVRLQLTSASSTSQPLDANTNAAPKAWRAQDLAVQVGIFNARLAPVGLSNLLYLQLVVLPSPTSIAPVLTKTVLRADFSSYALTWLNWHNGNGCQAEFRFTAAETDISLDAQRTKNYWLVVQGMTSTGQVLTYGAGWVTFLNPGSVVPAITPVPVSFHEQTNNTSPATSVVLPGSQVHTERIALSGIAGTRTVVLSTVGILPGATCDAIFTLPATPGINVLIHTGAASGTVVGSFSTDPGSGIATANFLFKFDGTAWFLVSSVTPAPTSGSFSQDFSSEFGT